MTRRRLIRPSRGIAAAIALFSMLPAAAEEGWTGTGIIDEVHDGSVVIGDGELAFSPDLRVNLASGVGSIGAQQLKPGLPVRFRIDEENPRLVREIWILNSAPKVGSKNGDER